MPITNFDFPGVALRQVFETASTATAGTLSVACIGQQFKLHRADVASEAAMISQQTVAYDATAGLTAAVPGRDAAGVIDTNTDTQRLVVRNGKYQYFQATSADIAPAIQATGVNLINFSSPVKDGGGFPAASQFGTRGAKVGDTVVLDGEESGDPKHVITEIVAINFLSGVGFAQIQVASLGGLTSSSTDVTVGFCADVDTVYQQGASTFAISSGNVVIQGGLTAGISELSGINGTLQKGDLYLEYREKMAEYKGKLGAVESPADVESVLGGVTPENPLALAVYFAAAASGGTIVYFTGVSSETPQAYIEAMDYLERFQDIYSIVPASEDEDIIKACMAQTLSASENEDSKIRRSLWYGITADKEIELYSGLATSSAADGITFAEQAFIEARPVAGDKIVRVSTGVEYTITATDGISNATVTPSAAAVSTPEQFTLIRTSPSNAEYIENIIAKRVVSSYRAQAVWADDILFNGDVIGGFAGAAAAAGMRSGEPCQRPLSNLTYSFFTVAEPHGFTKSQLKQIGSNGVWIIGNNSDGVPINMRQITTAVSNNINMDEESIVANADEIGMSLSHIGESAVGCSNISPQLLASLSDAITITMKSKLLNTTGSVYIGPQLLDWELLDIYQDQVNLDHVYADITCTPPKPFNKFYLTLRVI